MKKVFVFCVGGTGLRVMKSITMLMAAGMDTNGYTIVPIKVDPHRDLDERKSLNTLLDDYMKIYKSTITDEGQTLNPLKGFFSAEMTDLPSLNNQQNDKDELGGEERRFEDYINAKLPDNDVNKYLVQTLYSQKNLTNKLSVGFKGNPNVGTVVLGDMIENGHWFDSFKDKCQEDDRIFIISSIFGGTGASGYPIIEKKIKAMDDMPNVKNALRGAVTVLPYYSLEDPGITNSDIDSTSFLTKTKSALSYYDDHISSDYLYYVGEKTSMWGSYENNEVEQKDKAHFIELVAASALFDFLHRERQDTPQYMSRTIKHDEKSLDRESLGDGYNEIVKHLADFSLLRLIINTLPDENYFPLKKRRNMDEKFYNGESYQALISFANKFQQWYDEMATNMRAFAPLNVEKTSNLSGWIKGTALELNNDSDILLGMVKSSRSENEKHNNRLRYLLKFAYDAINKYTQVIK